MYSVYKLTLPDGRAYIGMTGVDKLYKRWQYGSGYSKNKRLYNEILNIGWKNIQKEVLAQVEAKEAATQLEIYYIGLYKTYLPECGFNTAGKRSFNEPKDHYKYVNVELGLEYPTLEAAGHSVGVCKEAIRISIKRGSACGKGKKKFHFVKVKT